MFPVVLALAGVGFVAALAAALKRAPAGSSISYQPPTSSGVGPGYLPSVVIPKGFTPEIIASATKWAAARGVPAREILATILVESSGNPRAWNHANPAKEDSRGLMQVNVNAWGASLAQYGLTIADLWDIDKNIQVGSAIYASYRAKVQTLIAQSGVPQSAPLDVLTRLYYKGPAYVQKKILAGEDASHPYKNSDAAVANWKVAMTKANQVTSAG